MTPRRAAFVNARLVDPYADYDGPGGVVIEDGRILDSGAGVVAGAAGSDAEIIDCDGKLLCPGLIDLRVFCDEPGPGRRETFETMGDAAAAGGVTTVALMPDAAPPLDDPALIELAVRKAQDDCAVRVRPFGALTKGLSDDEMADYGRMLDAGAAGFTNADGVIADAGMMRRCMDYARAFDALVAPTAYDPSLQGDAVAVESELASRLGLAAAPAAAERIGLARDLALAELTGCRYHAALTTTAHGVNAVERAKDAGLRVTAAAPVSHLVFNEIDIAEGDPAFRLFPPLRSEDDRAELAHAVSSGVIDALVSSHRPLSANEKDAPFSDAAPGAVGLETLLAGALALYHEGAVPLIRLIDAMTRAPADVLALPQGRLSPDAPADFIIADIDKPFVLNTDDLRSKSRNTPFAGRRLQGVVLKTFVAGVEIFSRPL